MTSFFIGSQYARLLNERNKLKDVCYSWGIDCNINRVDLYVTDKQNEKLKNIKSYIEWCIASGTKNNNENFHDLRSMVEFLGTNQTEKLLFAWKTYVDTSFKSLMDEKLVIRKRRKLSL